MLASLTKFKELCSRKGHDISAAAEAAATATPGGTISTASFATKSAAQTSSGTFALCNLRRLGKKNIRYLVAQSANKKIQAPQAPV